MITFKRHLPIRFGAAATMTALMLAGVSAGVSPRANADAADGTQPPSVTVRFADLNLTRTPDVKILYRRLEQASASVCGRFDSLNLAARGRWQQCYHDALRGAIMQVDSPVLLALYHDRNSRPGSAG